MKKKLLFLSLALTVSTISYAQEKGKELFIQKCSTCHAMEIPKDKSTMLGPPAKGIMFHMKEEFKSNEKIKAHIESFVLNPSLEKAICKSVRRFGLMPSQKGNITEDQLKTVSQWMIENLHMSKEEHNKNQRKHKHQ